MSLASQKQIQMDFNTEFRRTYLGAAPHTLATGLIWLISAALGQWGTKTQSIIFFIAAGTFIFPFGELLRKLMQAPNLMSQENSLPRLFMLLAFTIPLSYPLIYLACKGNTNFFYPAFSVLVGAHYLPFIYGYRMPVFGIMSGLLVSQGLICSIYYPESFALSAIITGIILVFFGLVNYSRIKKELV